MRTGTFDSGTVRRIPETLSYPVVGLDPDGRLVVLVEGPDGPQDPRTWTMGLTLCCDAFDDERDGVRVCLSCGRTVDVGRPDAVVLDPLVAESDAEVPKPRTGEHETMNDQTQQVPVTDVWMWLAVPHIGKEHLLMAEVQDADAGRVSRPLMALDEETAHAYRDIAQAAANNLGVDAVLRHYTAGEPLDRVSPQ